MAVPLGPQGRHQEETGDVCGRVSPSPCWVSRRNQTLRPGLWRAPRQLVMRPTLRAVLLSTLQCQRVNHRWPRQAVGRGRGSQLHRTTRRSPRATAAYQGANNSAGCSVSWSPNGSERAWERSLRQNACAARHCRDSGPPNRPHNNCVHVITSSRCHAETYESRQVPPPLLPPPVPLARSHDDIIARPTNPTTTRANLCARPLPGHCGCECCCPCCCSLLPLQGVNGATGCACAQTSPATSICTVRQQFP